jgi:hypothetical protein
MHFIKNSLIIKFQIMATKGKTRGPQESKYINKENAQDEKHATKRKRVEKKTGAKKTG